MLDDGKTPAQRLNLVDRVVTFFSPEAGMRRMAARHTLHEFGYNDAPERRGDSGGQVKNAAGESYMNHRDRIQAMWDARDAATGFNSNVLEAHPRSGRKTVLSPH